jgi:hypothetical protein
MVRREASAKSSLGAATRRRKEEDEIFIHRLPTTLLNISFA